MADNKKITELPLSIPSGGFNFIAATGAPTNSNYRIPYVDIAEYSSIGTKTGQFTDKLTISGLTVLTSTDSSDLKNKIAIVSGNVNTVSGNLVATGVTLLSDIDTVSSNLSTTGATLLSEIGTVSSNLSTTGAFLLSSLSEVSGSLDNVSGSLNDVSGKVDALSGNLISTGSLLLDSVTEVSGNVDTLSGNLIATGTSLLSSLTYVSGEVDGILTTGLATESGEFSKSLTISGRSVVTGDSLSVGSADYGLLIKKSGDSQLLNLEDSTPVGQTQFFITPPNAPGVPPKIILSKSAQYGARPGNSSYDSIIGGRDHLMTGNMDPVFGGDIAGNAIVGGRSHKIIADDNFVHTSSSSYFNSILGGWTNEIWNSKYSTILGGAFSRVADSQNSFALGSNILITGSDYSIGAGRHISNSTADYSFTFSDTAVTTQGETSTALFDLANGIKITGGGQLTAKIGDFSQSVTADAGSFTSALTASGIPVTLGVGLEDGEVVYYSGSRFRGDKSRLSITDVGVGVNAPNPAYTLEVGGDMNIQGTLYTGGSVIDVTSEQLNTSGALIYLNSGEVGAGVTTDLAGLLVDRGTLPSGYMLFTESYKGWSPSHNFVVTGGINLGIGTTSPTSALHMTSGKLTALTGEFSDTLTISGVPVITGYKHSYSGSVGGTPLSTTPITYFNADSPLGDTAFQKLHGYIPQGLSGGLNVEVSRGTGSSSQAFCCTAYVEDSVATAYSGWTLKAGYASHNFREFFNTNSNAAVFVSSRPDGSSNPDVYSLPYSNGAKAASASFSQASIETTGPGYFDLFLESGVTRVYVIDEPIGFGITDLGASYHSLELGRGNIYGTSGSFPQGLTVKGVDVSTGIYSTNASVPIPQKVGASIWAHSVKRTKAVLASTLASDLGDVTTAMFVWGETDEGTSDHEDWDDFAGFVPMSPDFLAQGGSNAQRVINSRSIRGLSNGTKFYARVKYVAGGTAYWSDAISFTTSTVGPEDIPFYSSDPYSVSPLAPLITTGQYNVLDERYSHFSTRSQVSHIASQTKQARFGFHSNLSPVQAKLDVIGDLSNDNCPVALFNSGNVGIGNYDPQAQLDVTGQILATSGAFTDEVTVGTSNGTALIANDAGNVGIGWSGTPTEPIAAQLHVSGSTMISGHSELTLDYDRLPKSNPNIKGRVWIDAGAGTLMISSGVAGPSATSIQWFEVDGSNLKMLNSANSDVTSLYQYWVADGAESYKPALPGDTTTVDIQFFEINGDGDVQPRLNP